MPAQYVHGDTITLELACPDGVPSAASVDVYHPETGLLDSDSATLPTVSATLTANAGEHALTLTVDDASGLKPGRLYLLVTTLGERLEVKVAGAGGTTIKLESGLQIEALTGSKIYDHIVTRDVTALDLDRERCYRARWQITVDGVAQRRETTFDVVRQIVSLVLSEDDLKGTLSSIKPPADWRTSLVPDALAELEDLALVRGLFLDQLRRPEKLKRPAAIMVAMATLTGQITEKGRDTKADHKAIESLEKKLRVALDGLWSAHWWDLDDDDLRAEDGSEETGHKFVVATWGNS